MSPAIEQMFDAARGRILGRIALIAIEATEERDRKVKASTEHLNRIHGNYQRYQRENSVKFIHNDVYIRVDERTGKFSAEVNGNRLVSSSLDGIKRKINDAVAKVFEKFQAIICDDNDQIKSVLIEGIRKDSRGRGDHRFYYIDEGGTEQIIGYSWTGHYGLGNIVLHDTPENRKLLQTLVEAKEHLQRTKKEIEKRYDDARDAITSLKASDFVDRKPASKS